MYLLCGCVQCVKEKWKIHIWHELWAGQFYSRGAYTIFRHTRAEIPHSRFRAGSESGTFGQGMAKNILF